MSQRCRLITPAYALSDAESLAKAEGQTADLIAALGWQLSLGAACRQFGGRGWRAARGARVADISRDGCDWLWALRGGYGCSELLPLLSDWNPAPAPRIIGFSDLTVLHAYWQRRGWRPGIYGLMPAVPHGQQAIASLHSCLAAQTLRWNHRSHREVRILKHGTAEGPIFAACLRVLAACVGGPAEPNLRGCILAIEDVDEAPYAIDRDLQQLHQAGLLSDIVGLIGGAFTWDDGRAWAADDAAGVLATWAQELDLPCIIGLPFGHVPDPLSLPQFANSVFRTDGAGWDLTISPAFH